MVFISLLTPERHGSSRKESCYFWVAEFYLIAALSGARYCSHLKPADAVLLTEGAAGPDPGPEIMSLES